MTTFRVRHVTAYSYRRPVRFGRHRLMFRPRDSHDQRLLGAELAVTPAPSGVRWILDVFGNCVALVDIAAAADELRFETRIALDHTPQDELSLEVDPETLTWPFAYHPEEAADLAPTIRPHYPDPEVERWARRFLHPGGRTETGRLLMTLCYAIHESFVYSRRVEPGTQPPRLTLAVRRGTCRDFALLMMEAVRSLGFAARFVTGYVYVPDRDGPIRCRPAAAARPTPGARSTCPAPAGWTSTPPTASSATATSSAWRSPATRARPCRSAAASSAPKGISPACRCR